MTNPKHTDTSRSGDLIKRLRKQAYFADRSAEDAFNEAADRIEELEAWKAAEEAHHHMLRQELDRCRASNAVMDNTAASLTAEVERLREALEESWALNVNYHAVEEPDGYQFTEAPAVIEMARAALEGTSHE